MILLWALAQAVEPSSPTGLLACDLVALDKKRYSLDAAMNMSVPRQGGALKIVRTSLPNVSGEYTGLADNFQPPREGEAAFMREEGELATAFVVRAFKTAEPLSVTISVVRTDNVDDHQPAFIAGGVCTVKESQ